MDKEDILLIVAFILGVIALAHLLRSIFGWAVTIGSFKVPVYFSYIAFVLFVYLSWEMYSLSKK